MKYALVVTLLLPIVCLAQTREDVLREYFEAIGGVDNWANVNSSKSIYNGVYNKDSSRSWTVSKLPKQSVTRIKSKIGPAMEFYHNEKLSGIVSNGEFRPLSIDFGYYQLTPATTLRDLYRFDEIKYLKSVEERGAKYHVLEGQMAPESKRVGQYYFNASTHLLDIITAEFNGISQKTFITDYRFVGPLLVPYSMETYNNGQVISTSKILKIEFNPVIDTTIFYYQEGKNLEHLFKK